MDNLNFVVVWNKGKDPECVLATQDRASAVALFEKLMGDSKLDQIKLYGPNVPSRRWEPAEAARIVAENSKRLKAEAEALENKSKEEAKQRLAKAREELKEAEAKAKDAGLKA